MNATPSLFGDVMRTNLAGGKPAERMPGMVAKLRTVREAVPSRRDGPQTSHEAAAAMATHASRLESMALSLITLAGDHGRTFDEIAAALDWPQSQSGRITALLGRGLIVDSGARRKTRSGHNARVYVAKQ